MPCCISLLQYALLYINNAVYLYVLHLSALQNLQFCFCYIATLLSAATQWKAISSSILIINTIYNKLQSIFLNSMQWNKTYTKNQPNQAASLGLSESKTNKEQKIFLTLCYYTQYMYAYVWFQIWSSSCVINFSF